MAFSWVRRIVVASGVVAAVAMPVSTQAPRDPSFDVVSIKINADGFIDLGGGLRLLRGETRCQGVDSRVIPGDPIPAPGPGRCVIRNSTLKEIIDQAFETRFGTVRAVLNSMITGGPPWAETTAFDVDGRAESASATSADLRGMLRSMLRERFDLRFHRERRQTTGLALVVAKDGPRLKAGDPSARPVFSAAPVVHGENVPIATIANLLAQRLGQRVSDKTGLAGVYTFTLTWTPQPTELGVNGAPARNSPDDAVAGSLVTALRDQLGLALQTERVDVDAFVIESASLPRPN